MLLNISAEYRPIADFPDDGNCHFNEPVGASLKVTVDVHFDSLEGKSLSEVLHETSLFLGEEIEVAT